jgi:hypothetical protein
MKIIQSYWSYPNRINEINDPNGRHNGGWIQRESSLFCWALSVLKLRQFYDTVELVTDSDGWAELIRDVNLPYTNVSTELDKLQDVHPNLWSMGKLYTYSIQKEHFIHVDGDFIIWKEFPKEICNSDAVAQNREIGYPYYYLIKDQIKDFHLLPPSLNNSPIISINAGIIGGKKVFLFDKLYQKASDFIRVNKGLFHTCNVGLLNIIIEQLSFHEICSDEKINISYLFNHMSDDFHECLQFNAVPRFAKYVHTIGSAKRDPLICLQIEHLLQIEFPQFHKKIKDYFLQLKGSSVTNSNLPKSVQSRRQQIFDNRLKWMGLGEGQYLSVRFQLSPTCRVSYNKEGILTLSYLCVFENKRKYLLLEGWTEIIARFSEPLSIEELICQFEEYPFKDSELKEIHKSIVNTLTIFMFYYNAISLA